MFICYVFIWSPFISCFKCSHIHMVSRSWLRDCSCIIINMGLKYDGLSIWVFLPFWGGIFRYFWGFMQGCTLDSSQGRPNFDIFNHCGKLGKIVILEHFIPLVRSFLVDQGIVVEVTILTMKRMISVYNIIICLFK